MESTLLGVGFTTFLVLIGSGEAITALDTMLTVAEPSERLSAEPSVKKLSSLAISMLLQLSFIPPGELKFILLV